MEAWELAYIGKKMEIPVARESHSGCSAITITQFGRNKEEAIERFNNTVNESKRLSEPRYETTKKGCTVQWTEQACLEPKVSGTWKRSDKRYRMSASKQ